MSILVLAEQEDYGIEMIDEVDSTRFDQVLKSYPPGEYSRLVLVDLEAGQVTEFKRSTPIWVAS